jgi:hypothetical protein
MPGDTQDPGTGLEFAEFLAHEQPMCPVIIHTSNAERRWSMYNELRFGGWTVEIVPPVGEGWINRVWLRRAKDLIGVKELCGMTPRQEQQPQTRGWTR